MKIRKGFVSNSSTANFIVRIKNDDWYKKLEAEFLVDKEDIPKLEEYGFKMTNLTNPFEKGDGSNVPESPDNYVSMKLFVVCNDEEVIEFLVKNNIPFKASVHYNQKYVSYQKDSDHIFEATNYGTIFNMYGEGHYRHFTKKDMKDLDFKPYRKIPKKEYLQK